MGIKQGMTLVEMMIILALIGLLSGAAIVSVQTFKLKQSLNLAIEQVVNASNRARIYSREGRQEKIWGIANLGSTEIRVISKNNSGEKVEEQIILGAPVEIASGDFKLWFKPISGDTGVNTNLILKSGKFSRQINISQTGIINSL